MIKLLLNYYGLLGVEKDADDETIKKGVRRMTVWLHPDKHPGNKVAEMLMPFLGLAEETLLDAGKRAEYDRKLAEQAAKAKSKPAGTVEQPAASVAGSTGSDLLGMAETFAAAAAQRVVRGAVSKLFGGNR